MFDWQNKLEPEAIESIPSHDTDLMCHASIAISLKRIADELKALNDHMQK